MGSLEKFLEPLKFECCMSYLKVMDAKLKPMFDEWIKQSVKYGAQLEQTTRTSFENDQHSQTHILELEEQLKHFHKINSELSNAKTLLEERVEENKTKSHVLAEELKQTLNVYKQLQSQHSESATKIAIIPTLQAHIKEIKKSNASLSQEKESRQLMLQQAQEQLKLVESKYDDCFRQKLIYEAQSCSLKTKEDNLWKMLVQVQDDLKTAKELEMKLKLERARLEHRAQQAEQMKQEFETRLAESKLAEQRNLSTQQDLHRVNCEMYQNQIRSLQNDLNKKSKVCEKFKSMYESQTSDTQDLTEDF